MKLMNIACRFGYLSIVQYLIEKGANIEAKNQYQYTPPTIASILHISIFERQAMIVLFKYNA